MNNILEITNKDVKLTTSLFIIFSVGIMLTLLSYIMEKMYPIQQYCGNDEISCPTHSILVVRFCHYTIMFSIFFYYFIFNKKYDLYFLLLFTGILFNWILFKFFGNTHSLCLLNMIENSYYYEYDSKYINNYIKKNDLIVKTLFGKYSDIGFAIIWALTLLSFTLTVYRHTPEYGTLYVFLAIIIFYKIILEFDINN